MSDFVQESRGLFDGAVESHGCAGDLRGDGDLGVLEPLLEEGGQEPVDEGEARCRPV